VEDHTTLNLIYQLCQALAEHGVTYCHWKSNAALARSASGDNDLDLLVDRASSERFTEVLRKCGFKEARLPPGRELPGVLDYYGYDRESGKMVHVHAHYQLILGHDLTKNCHLPIEKPYLGTAMQGDLFRVPAPEFEFIVYVIRMMLKHATWGSVLGRQDRLSSSEREELEYLQKRINYAQLCRVLEEYLPYVDLASFEDCVQALRPDCPPWARIRAGRRMQSCLRACLRRPQLIDAWLKLWRRGLEAIERRAFGYVPRKRMVSGGVMVAIVGGDGAGKSTAVDGLWQWLSEEFAVTKTHMGKPSWSATTIAVRGILKTGRSLGLYPYTRVPVTYVPESAACQFPGYPWLLREVCTARDRYLSYRSARRFADNGGVVICDRFPLPQIQSIDGPQAERMAAGQRDNRVVRFLARLENHYYRFISLPDLLILLRVDPETCVRRKTDEDAASVYARAAELWKLDWRQAPACVIDASREKGEVLSELKALMWSQL
jgi:thymidylate kinase